MTIVSKYIALKNYIPIGLPAEENFEIKSAIKAKLALGGPR